ncbi:MAG TPA: hypothetical protein VNI52_14145 [Sphingobacteriaceae bacterium]|nr:hypothetical protein [Sphingobacteriaceae bacterium]
MEFIARFDNNNSSARAFDHTSILFVSEIALVTQNVEEAAKKLIIEENLSYFSKQIQRSDFAVFGDDNGLLILVEENRTWFPTNLKATKFWTKIKIEHENKEIEIEHGSIE